MQQIYDLFPESQCESDMGDGKEVTCSKCGDIHVYNNDNKEVVLCLKHVLYAPLSCKNIISIGKFFQQEQYDVEMRGTLLTIKKKDHSDVLNFTRHDQQVFYYLRAKGLNLTNK